MSTKIATPRQRFSSGFLAGLLAGLVASVLMLLLSWTINGVSLPEVFGSTFTFITPLPVFEYLHRVIGVDAKYYLFVGIFIGQCLVFALCGGFCSLLAPRLPWSSDAQGQLRWQVGIALALLLWLLTGLLLLPIFGAGIFGASLVIGIGSTMFSLAIVGLAFGLLFIYWQNQRARRGQREQDETQEQQSRRTLLRRGLGVLGIFAMGAVAWRFITGSSGSAVSPNSAQLLKQYQKKVVPPPVPNYGDITQVTHLSSEITPNDQYYIVSKNLASDPNVNSQGWRLTVEGEVAHPYSLTYDELLQLPMKQQNESMMCISNEVGGEYMSSALWEGVPLADLLAKAGGVKDGAVKVAMHAADDYSDSIAIAKALEPTTLLAVRMNGETLPTGHGYPARLLVPGIYGMKHIKWMTRIEVVKQDYQGYWQVRGWSDPAPIHMTTRIDTPLAMENLRANQSTYVAGVAFSGNKGISEVDISFDDGKTWKQATLKKPPSDLTWVLWELAWTPPKPGPYTITARAIDLEGNVQNPTVAPPLPDGSSGYHTVEVQVA